MHNLHIKENKPVVFQELTLEKFRDLMKRYPEGRQKSALVPILLIAQEQTGGFLTVDVLDEIASILQIKPIEVYEVATFYSMFSLGRVGKYVIELCRTGPCAMCGGEEILGYLRNKLRIDVGETTADGLFTLRTVECLAACGNAPVLQVNTEFYEKLTPEKIDRLIDELKSKAGKPIPFEETWAGKFC